MLKYIKQKIKNKFDMKSYSVGILQDQVYRILKNQTNLILESYELNSFDWAILGMLYESSEGENAIDLAKEKGVSQAFISKVVKKLYKNKYIIIKKEKDTRYKKIHLSELGKDKVTEIEPILKQKMRLLLTGIEVHEMYGYITTLKKISENSQKIAFVEKVF